MTLTVAAIERWDAESVREVFHAATRRAQATADAANGLATLPAFTNWGGVAAKAARDAIGQTRRDLDTHGRQATAVANAACNAADEIERIKSDLATLTADTQSMGMEIDSAAGKVLPGRSVHDPMEALLKEQQLQPRLDKIVAEANVVDMALANAIHMADGGTLAGPHRQTPTEPPPHDPKLPRAEVAAAAGDATDASAAAVGTTTSGQPTNLGEALAEVAGQPAGVLDRSLRAGSSDGEETHSTRSPLTAPSVGADHSLVDQQRARVESARQTLTAAQAKLDTAAAQTYTRGGNTGPVRDDADALSQAVFDARRELTAQTKTLEDLNNAAATLGAPTVAVPTLPENTDVQAFPAKPSAFAEGSRALSDGSFGLIPDVAKDIDVFGHWGKHSGAEQTGAILDAAGMVPIPGAKALTEGFGHGLDALNAGRHLEDGPTPHIHVDDVPTGGHSRTTETPHHHADTTDAHHIDHDTGHVALYGIEDTTGLLAMSEASGGHLMERHVGQTFDDLSARLAAGPRPGTVSTFATADQATAAVSRALQHNQAAIETWVANGAPERLTISTPFDGGAVLTRGATETVRGTSVWVILQGVGTGQWIVLTGYPKP